MYFVTKTFTFESAHKLNNYEGVCSRLHGHSYKVEVTLSGPSLNDIGMLVDFSTIRALAENLIIVKCDHRYLNDVFPNEVNTTAEVMAKSFFDSFRTIIHKMGYKCDIYSVKVWETSNNCAEYREVL